MPQDNAEFPDVLSATWVVDGLEGRLARVEVEAGQTVDLSLASLPRGTKEGDVLRIHVEGGDLSIEIDHAETVRRRTGAQQQLDALNSTFPTGEIDL